MMCCPPLPACGVPEIVAVPSPLYWKLTPLGRGSSVEILVGEPVVVTVKVPDESTVNVVLSLLVIVGDSSCAAAVLTRSAAATAAKKSVELLRLIVIFNCLLAAQMKNQSDV